jgi:ligand-binding SRPBCC domain-containing protein
MESVLPARATAPAETLSFSRRGRLHVLHSRQWVPVPIDACFAFFSDAANLESLTPPFLRFRILTPLPVEMRAGARIEYRLGLMGVPMNWLTRIDEWRPGRGFVDSQLRGPYAHWVHRHTFTPADSGTWVLDEIEYALPLAPLSNPAHALFVRPRLREIFGYRRQAIARLLGGEA